MTAWCTNIGDSLAVMLRPGNAGSITACDHIAVLTAAFGQIPATWRTDVLVSIDGAGASHEIIDHLTSLNTAAMHGNRGRRVEYTIGWPIDERTLAGISELRPCDWGDAVNTDGVCDPDAQVADLTGILRTGPLGTGWPPGPPTSGSSPAGSPDPPVSNPNSARTPSGNTARSPPTRHRAGAVARRSSPHPGHVEDRIKQLKACGARTLPSIDYDRNAAWLQLAALATSLTAWLCHLAPHGDLAKATTKTLRFRPLSAPARLVTHARHKTLKSHPAGNGPPT